MSGAAVIAIAALVTVSPLSVARAHERALREAKIAASAFAPREPKVTVDKRDCSRHSSASVDCVAIFKFKDDGVCQRSIRIRLVKGKLKPRWLGQPSCSG